MKCTRCGDELPSDTPICRRCGPPSFGSSPWASSPFSLASVDSPAPPPPVLTPPAPAAIAFPSPPVVAVAGPVVAVTGAVALPAPAGPQRQAKQQTKQTKQQKKERARQRLAERGLLTPEPRFAADRTPEPRFAADRAPAPEGPLPNLPELLERFGQKRDVVPDESPAPAQFPVPPAIRTLAQIDLVMGVASLFVARAMARGVGEAHAVAVGGGAYGIIPQVLMGVAFLGAAAGLMLLQPWGRKAQLALCVLSVPVGAGLCLPAAALIAIYLLRSGVALLLSGRNPGELTPAERGRIRDDMPSGVWLIRGAATFQMVVLAWRLWPVLGRL